MKQLIKKILKEDVIYKYQFSINRIYKQIRRPPTASEKIKCLLFDTRKVYIIHEYKFSEITKYIKKDVIYSKYFTYLIDFDCFEKNFLKFNHNITPDYKVILENSLQDLKRFYKNNEQELIFLDELEKYLSFYIEKVKMSDFKDKENTVKILKNIRDKKCQSFIEALQRILFFNQIFWQMGYTLCGLGRLDYILDEYYKKDINNETLSKDSTEEIIIDFFKILNSYFKDKSSTLNGDTGQIIIIGGEDKEGNNFENDLTYIFINALKKYNRPDPKLFLRVNKNTKQELFRKAIDCMATGIGSPLLSNDDVIIPKLTKFGYSLEDARNYVTAACWEPSPCGDTIDYNNIFTLNFLIPFNKVFETGQLDISMDELEKRVFKEIKNYIEEQLEKLSNLQFASQPYLSLFIKGCRETGTVISEGKAKYKNLGLTTLGISSIITSIINIKRLVFKKKILTLEELNKSRKENFKDDKVLDIIKANNKYGFGSNNEETIQITNQILNFISAEFDKYKTYYGGEFKFGLSSPAYIENGKTTEASFDSRKNGQSFGVHISSDYNNYLEIMDFASKIEYPKNCINGNVVDYILSSDYMKNNIGKFSDYIKTYLNNGIYQLQINVIDSKTLIDAKNNPELYKNLIVRVWGFSAYFNDLPEEYKDLLINRAKASEGLY